MNLEEFKDEIITNMDDKAEENQQFENQEKGIAEAKTRPANDFYKAAAGYLKEFSK